MSGARLDHDAFRAEGEEAFLAGARPEDNPYILAEEVEAARAWRDGWRRTAELALRWAKSGSTATESVTGEVVCERWRQHRVWGEQDQSNGRWLEVLTEELGEASKASLEGDARQRRIELVQAAAVIVAMIEAHDRARERERAS